VKHYEKENIGTLSQVKCRLSNKEMPRHQGLSYGRSSAKGLAGPDRSQSPQSLWIIWRVITYSPHKWQAHLAHALLSWENRVIVSTAATGAGKTLTFWLPILAGETAMTFIIVLLNVLGQQMADTMNETIYSADSESKEGPG
jgi:hypothetical protein